MPCFAEVLADSPVIVVIHGKYKKLLRSAGKEIVENHMLSEKIIEDLGKPIVPSSLYIKFGNEEWDRLIKENQTEYK